MTNAIRNPVILTERDLQALGYWIKQDITHPGKFVYVYNDEVNEFAFSTKEAAIHAATVAANGLFKFSQCQNCGNIHSEENLNVCRHYSMRVAPGETAPSGECPDCGSLCHYV